MNNVKMYQAHKDPIRGLRCVLDGRVQLHLGQLLVLTSSHLLATIVCIWWSLPSKSAMLNEMPFAKTESYCSIRFINENFKRSLSSDMSLKIWKSMYSVLKQLLIVHYKVLMVELVFFHVWYAHLIGYAILCRSCFLVDLNFVRFKNKPDNEKEFASKFERNKHQSLWNSSFSECTFHARSSGDGFCCK